MMADAVALVAGMLGVKVAEADRAEIVTVTEMMVADAMTVTGIMAMDAEMMMDQNPDLSPGDLSLIPVLPAEMMNQKTAAAVIALINENCASWHSM